MNNKTYKEPIAFDIDQPVIGIRRHTVYARSEEEAIQKVKDNRLTDRDSQWFDELKSDPLTNDCYAVDADESNIEPTY